MNSPNLVTSPVGVFKLLAGVYAEYFFEIFKIILMDVGKTLAEVLNTLFIMPLFHRKVVRFAL